MNKNGTFSTNSNTLNTPFKPEAEAKINFALCKVSSSKSAVSKVIEMDLQDEEKVCKDH